MLHRGGGRMRRREYGALRARVVREVEAALDDSDEGEGDPRPLDALDAEPADGWRIEERELRLAERLRVARERVSSRRARLGESGRAAGVTATELEARATQAAALSPTQAARWVGVDIDILQCDEPRVLGGGSGAASEVSGSGEGSHHPRAQGRRRGFGCVGAASCESAGAEHAGDDCARTRGRSQAPARGDGVKKDKIGEPARADGEAN